MEREPFIEEALDLMYEKAEKEGVIPWNDAIPDEDVSFPEDPCPAPELDWDDI